MSDTETETEPVAAEPRKPIADEYSYINQRMREIHPNGNGTSRTRRLAPSSGPVRANPDTDAARDELTHLLGNLKGVQYRNFQSRHPGWEDDFTEEEIHAYIVITKRIIRDNMTRP
jgi:hypothetical protein